MRNLFADRLCCHVRARQIAALRFLGLPLATLSLFGNRETFPRAIFSAQECRKDRPGRAKPVRRHWNTRLQAAAPKPALVDQERAPLVEPQPPWLTDPSIRASKAQVKA